MLGQIGLPGGGFGHGYGSMGDVGSHGRLLRLPTFRQGHNPVRTFIPVARIADLLLNPGASYDYNGKRLTYPDIRLVYWAGGNPFHHHQDLGRLRTAFGRPDTIVVHEPHWTATARHADIVLPVTTSLEREDIGSGRRDTHLIAMHRATAPVGQARDDHDILAALASRLGLRQAFTEDRTPRQWLEYLYGTWRDAMLKDGHDVPGFAEFWAAGEHRLPEGPAKFTLFERFRADPEGSPLRTPSGRIEITSDVIAGFGYPDCPGHPAWLEPREWLGGPLAQRFPLHLIANQPATRLHSQLDMGATSQRGKVAGREAVRMHPEDAAARGVLAGDVVRVFNDRGACLAGAVLTTAVRPGVVQLPTGAWFDPVPGVRAGPAVRARQPERADGRRADLAALPGLQRPARAGSGGALGRPAAAGDRRLPAADRERPGLRPGRLRRGLAARRAWACCRPRPRQRSRQRTAWAIRPAYRSTPPGASRG